MNIIIPMAGIGKRLFPHTLTTPKPLISIAGKPIVQRITEDIVKVCDEKAEEIAFVTGRFGEEVENDLLNIAKNLGAKGRIFYQDQALGTAHAVMCAKECLKRKVIVAFSDTLFKADFTLDSSKDGIIWVKKVQDPRQFGVVKIDGQGIVTDFIEKPQEMISNLAIIGIYYFKDGSFLRHELQYLLDNNITHSNEYQLTDALEAMKKSGIKFTTEQVTEWLDCGNKNAVIYSNSRILEFDKKVLIAENFINQNSIIIQPCFIGENVQIIDSKIGPYVSIGKNTIVENSLIENSIIQKDSKIVNAELNNSMIGNHVEFTGKSNDASIGDYNVIR